MSKVIGVIGFKSEIVMQVFKSEIVMEEPKSRKDGNIVYRESECLWWCMGRMVVIGWWLGMSIEM